LAGAGVGIGLAVSSPAPKPKVTIKAPTTFTPPKTIDTTCKVDDTASLGAWLMSVRDGTPGHDSIAKLKKGACYLVNGSWWWRGARNIDLDGNGATIRETSTTVPDTVVGGRDNPSVAPYCGSTAYMNDLYSGITSQVELLTLDGGCDLTIKDLTITGSHSSKSGDTPALQPDSFISIDGAQRVLLLDDTEHGPWGDFVTISGLHEAPGGGGGMPSTDVTIEHSRFSYAGRMGISETNGAHRVLISQDTFQGAGLTMFDDETDVTYAAAIDTDIDITHDKIIGQNYGYLFAAYTGTELQRVAITDLQLVTGAQIRIFVAPHNFGGSANANVLISGNTSTASSTWPNRSPVNVLNTVDVLVMGNTDPLPSIGGTGYPFATLGKSSSLACGNKTPTGVAFDAACPSQLPAIVPPAVPALPN
jgi:hypothetical protein